jgi:SAM-dependent methyltransferase
MNLKRTIRHWRLKALIQRFLSAIPGGGRVNDYLQTSIGGLTEFEGNIAGKIDDWVCMMSYLEAVNRANLEGLTMLEIGTGWYPTFPVCLILAGAQRVYTVDLNRHLNGPLTMRMLGAMEAHLHRIANLSGQPVERVRETYDRLRRAGGLEELLRVANIEYHAPQNAAELDWIPADSLDIVYSNSVLEHVFPAEIPRLMSESWRVLKPDGLQLHEVACNDHYAIADKNISFVNYLQYSDRQWSFWNNRLHYQNRLRAPDFTKFARDNGFHILHEARATRPGTREAMSRMRIAPRFRGYSPEDLASTTVDFVAGKSRGVAEERCSV